MKKYYIIWFLFIASNLISQSKKYDTIVFENISLNNHHLFFRLKQMPNLEKYLSKIEKKVNISTDKKIIPLTKKRLAINEFSNKNTILFTTKDSAFIHYFNFEKSQREIILKLKNKKITFSNNYSLYEFRKAFPNSYKLAKGINATPLSRAAFIPVFIIRSTSKGYLCFTFYDEKLIDVFLSDNEPETPY
ncbi:hypothetical protein [Flavobacterium aquidurense]|uniref:Uncharacterized protein n=1 Tax=Flavobacterium aquidurense TaxID=362413 RepID=A0A0Q0W7U1_9FLAO|nr:hypothetical protein [Flavobacterium aquidurense]KQB40454.1 hypothetical protein RC62_344 [Flavobacterium aquidurense]